MIEYLSYSSISKYLSCGESWKRHYLNREETPGSPALVLGSAVHNAIETYITERAIGGDPPGLDSHFAAAWDEQIEDPRNQNIDWGVDGREETYRDGLRMLSGQELYGLADSLTPARDPDGLIIERKLTLNVPGVPVPIIGYLDIMTNDGVPGDFKTSSRKWSRDKAQGEIQPLFYLAALNQMGFKMPRNLAFRHYVITKTKTPSVQTIETLHTWDELFWVQQLIKSVWDAIEAEVFPINPGSWLCSPKFCGFWGTCRGRGI